MYNVLWIKCIVIHLNSWKFLIFIVIISWNCSVIFYHMLPSAVHSCFDCFGFPLIFFINTTFVFGLNSILLNVIENIINLLLFIYIFISLYKKLKHFKFLMLMFYLRSIKKTVNALVSNNVSDVKVPNLKQQHCQQVIFYLIFFLYINDIM